MQSVLSTNVRSSTTQVVASQTGPGELDEIVCAAVEASAELSMHTRDWRASLLRRISAELQARAETIVAIADGETAIGEARLLGEMNRTCAQLRAFADVLDDGGYLEVTIDHARPDTTPPRPDLRRMLVPLGPVAVFGASNFPLAFSVPGGDTASALAAGSAVIAKVHESHPATSIACHEAIEAACLDHGAPGASVQLVFGRDAGVQLVTHPAVRAASFTGSLGGGKALLDAINNRSDPIPFYAEMASINPVVVTARAAAQRGQALGEQLGQSLVTLSGQICTKPGLVFVPTGAAGDLVVAGIAEVVNRFEPQVALNQGIAATFREHYQRASTTDGLAVLGGGAPAGDTELSAHLLSIDIDLIGPETVSENFGPAQLVARYRDVAQLSAALSRLTPSLTATIQFEEDELHDSGLVGVVRKLEGLAGRMIFNGVPTGVAVAWAQHHGGPWPATNSIHTSVGATAIRRFLRPFTWQDAPVDLLPAELRDGATGLPRRIDGVVVV